MGSYFSLKKNRGEVVITIGGHLKASDVPSLSEFFSANRFYKSQSVCVDLKALETVDTSGSWALLHFVSQLKKNHIPIRFEHVSKDVRRVLDQVSSHMTESLELPPSQIKMWIHSLEGIGRKSYQAFETSFSLINFLGQCVVAFFLALLRPKKFRIRELATMIQRVGFDSLPIVGLISFLIGVVLIYQSVDQLKRFGAEVFSVDLLTISVMREIGILLTAIVVAGRSGSAFTAQLGFMKLNEEVDAMIVMAMNPIEVLILPRILALMISMPLLAFYSDMMGLLGGAFMSLFLLELSFEQFFQQVRLAIGPWTFWIGVIKAPFFAALIGLIACFEGMRVHGGSQSVGIHTTKSVVEGIFMVIVLDALFSIMFSYMGI
ncbi:MAG: MlaE family lipid ABC transporter permease subunit [Caedimonadaceae bacterium]|nr:MAG: MlaE family lipid ABC transporter permease subunit [Caedimonadaceae bacterium]